MDKIKLFLIAALVVLFISCTKSDNPVQAVPKIAITGPLPSKAENIQDLGNGWYSFELNNSNFMCYSNFWERQSTDGTFVVGHTFSFTHTQFLMEK